MTRLNLEAAQHAMMLRKKEFISVSIGSLALALVCAGVIGAAGAVIWYALAVGSLLLERLVYKHAIASGRTDHIAEWRLGLSTVAVVIAYMSAGLIMSLDPRPWAIAGGASMTFISLMNSGHFRKVSQRIGQATQATILAIALPTPLIVAAASPAPFWLGALLMTALSGIGIGLVLRHLHAKDQAEADLAEALQRAELAKEEARGQTHLIQRIFEQEQRAIAMLDSNLRVVMANRRWAAAQGGEPQDFVGRGFYDLVTDAPPHWAEVFQRALRGEHMRSERDLLRTRAGQLRCLRWEVTPWRMADGEIGGVIAFSEDVTAFYEAEREAAESGKILRLAASAAAAGVWRLDLAERKIWTSPEYEEILGDRPTFEDFSSSRPSWLLEEDYERYQDIMRVLARPGARATLDHRLRTQGDAPMWVHSVMEAIGDESGHVRWIVGMTQNVTERKQMEVQILQITRQAEASLAEKRSMHDTIAMELDAVAALADSQERAEDSPATGSGVDLAELLERLMRVLKQIDLRDSALNEAILALRSAREAAASASAAKSQFLATMSHELRTPLNAVIGYAEMLEEELADHGIEQGAADAARIQRAAKSLLVLINEVLDFSKIDAGRLTLVTEETDVEEVIGQTCELTRHLATANGNTLEVSIDPSVRRLEIDSNRLRQCLLNLVSNACKFTQDGSIRVSARMRPVHGGEQLAISVKDTGQGISAEHQATLFQPFVQVDGSRTRRHDGTGLGLVITQRLAQLMGGDVTLESELGRGSVFTLTVVGQRVGSILAEGEGAGTGGPPIVVIEDEPVALDIYKRIFARMPVSAFYARTAAEGEDLVRELEPALVLLDVGLPDVSGWELLALIKRDERLARTPVIICSVDDDRAKALACGARDAIVKPFDRAIIMEAVNGVISSGAKSTAA